MTPKLKINEFSHGFCIGWYFPDEDDWGSMLGETKYTTDALNAEDREERECAVAYLTALKTEGVEMGYNCLQWKWRSEATKALNTIRLALEHADHPWPEWALMAKAAGWSPPEGWKP